MATGDERLEHEGHNDFALQCCVEVHAVGMEMRLMSC